MRTRTLLLLLSFAPMVTAFAQKDDDKEKSNGVRLGWHMSNLEGPVDSDVRNGYYIGYYRNWVKVPLFSFSTGLEVNTAGATPDDTELRLTYLTLPVNGRLKLGPVYFDLGIDAALKVSEKWVVDGTEFDIPDGADAESFDVLAHVGAGFKFLFMGVEARYRYGLTEAYDGYRNTGLEVGLITFF